VTGPEDVPVEVSALFETLALNLHSAGIVRYSADAILHRIRWEMHVTRGNRAFVANNNWAAPLARWFMARNPSCGKFFELRERISA
jgi:hypothetical protein